MSDQENSFELIRQYKGRKVHIRAAFSDETHDWTMLSFVDDDLAVRDARTGQDVWREAEDILNLLLGR